MGRSVHTTSLKRVSSPFGMNTSYSHTSTEVTLASVKKLIAEEEHMRAARGDVDVKALDLTSSDFIIMGLEIEDLQ